MSKQTTKAESGVAPDMSLREAYDIQRAKERAERLKVQATCKHKDVWMRRTEFLERIKSFECNACKLEEEFYGGSGVLLEAYKVQQAEKRAKALAEQKAREEACEHDLYVDRDKSKGLFFHPLVVRCMKCHMEGPYTKGA